MDKQWNARIIKVFSKILISLLMLAGVSKSALSQDLMALLDEQEQPTTFTQGTFKSVRLINGYSCETAGKHDLVFSISHRFGEVTTGAYDLFGLDESNIRFGFEYGVNDRLSLGIGRSNFNKVYDGFVKYKFARQSTGEKSFPFTITWLSGMAVQTQKWLRPDLDYPFTARLYYVHELFIAHKFNYGFSAQLTPVVVHRNMVATPDDENLVGGIGFGGLYSVNNWLSVTGEYYFVLPGETANKNHNAFSIGVDMETGGGHVFQVHVSNSRGMTEKSFIPETTSSWFDGDVRIGFNIIRVFHLKKK